MTKVFTLEGEIINVGDWDYKVYQEPIINNPFPGPMEAPEDWDFQFTYEDRVGNPLPEGAIEEDIEIIYDSEGRVRRADEAEKYDLIARLAEAKRELDELMVDIQLGMATPEEVARAKELRTFIKDNPVAAL